MGQPFFGEIRLMSFIFAPRNWALCNGQLLQIAQNQALFSLLGTMYGGNGQTNFALPDLRGRVPAHVGNQLSVQGQALGEAAHTLTTNEMPAHNHTMMARAENGIAGLAGIVPGNTKSLAQALVSLPNNGTTQAQIYGTGAVDRTMAPGAFANNGGSQPHENRQPFLTLSFCIALFGIFPSRN